MVQELNKIFSLIRGVLAPLLNSKCTSSLLLMLFMLSASISAQTGNNQVSSQSATLQIASLEQAYDSQIIQILSNHFDRKKFFVDVNIDAEFITETFQTTDNQVVTRRPQTFLPGLPFLPDENLQNSATNQSPETIVNQNTLKSLQLNSLAVNIYADTSLSLTDIQFMRRVAGFAAKIDSSRGDVINISQLAIPNPDVKPASVITIEDPEPQSVDLLTSFKDYIVEIILLGVFLLGLLGYGYLRKSKDQTNYQSQRDNIKSDITLDGTLNPDSSLGFYGSSKDESRNIAAEFESVSENFFKYPQEVALVFEFWVDSDEKNGPSNVAEVISAIDQSSLKLIQNHIDENKLEIIKQALIDLKPMSIDEKYRAAKYFNSVIESEDTNTKSSKKHAKLGLFKFLTHLPDDTIAELIRTENNVSAALIIDYLPQQKAASILNSFERTRAAEIMLKMSTLHTLSYKEQSKISNGLFEKAIVVRDKEHHEDYGIENILPILESLPVDEQKKYIEQLKATGSPVGDILEKEFFTIDQIPELDDEVVKNGIDDIDTATLLDALTGLDQNSIDKLLLSRPKREQQLIRLELENLNGDQKYNPEAKMALVSSLRESIKLSKEDQD